MLLVLEKLETVSPTLLVLKLYLMGNSRNKKLK